MSNYRWIDPCPTPREGWDEGGHDRLDISGANGSVVIVQGKRIDPMLL
jgi:hypothetical protein